MEYEYKLYIQKHLNCFERFVYMLLKAYTYKIYKIGNQRSFEFIYNSGATHKLICDDHTKI